MAACVGNHMLSKVWIMDVITYPCWDYPCYQKMSHFRFQYAVKCDMSFVKHHSNWDWRGRALFRFSSVNAWWYMDGGRKPCTYVSIMTRWGVDRNVQWRPFIARFIIANILYSSILINLHNMLPFKLIKDTRYLALSGELWSVFYEYFNRNWSCYRGFLL